ncbi:hypothetical protein ACFOJ6_12850 [Gordonia humi]
MTPKISSTSQWMRPPPAISNPNVSASITGPIRMIHLLPPSS